MVSILAINHFLDLRITIPWGRHPYWGVVEYADAIADRLRDKTLNELRTISVVTRLTPMEIAVLAMEAEVGVRGSSIYAKGLEVRSDGQILVDSQIVGQVDPKVAQWALKPKGNGHPERMAHAA